MASNFRIAKGALPEWHDLYEAGSQDLVDMEDIWLMVDGTVSGDDVVDDEGYVKGLYYKNFIESKFIRNTHELPLGNYWIEHTNYIAAKGTAFPFKECPVWTKYCISPGPNGWEDYNITVARERGTGYLKVSGIPASPPTDSTNTVPTDRWVPYVIPFALVGGGGAGGYGYSGAADSNDGGGGGGGGTVYGLLRFPLAKDCKYALTIGHCGRTYDKNQLPCERELWDGHDSTITLPLNDGSGREYTATAEGGHGGSYATDGKDGIRHAGGRGGNGYTGPVPLWYWASGADGGRSYFVDGDNADAKGFSGSSTSDLVITSYGSEFPINFPGGCSGGAGSSDSGAGGGGASHFGAGAPAGSGTSNYGAGGGGGDSGLVINAFGGQGGPGAFFIWLPDPDLADILL